MAQALMQGSSGDLDFDYPLEGMEKNDVRRSAMKKPGKARSAHNSSMLMKVSFREVHLREYGMVMGDNPAVSHGAPVQLDWEPQECHDPVYIDNYEKARSLWRAKDRRGFLLNAHKRVKILFAAGYTIDEIAKATMEMKELRQLRAESLKTQGMMTGAIMALLSGAAEGTGRTVRAATILPNALAASTKVVLTGTVTSVMGAGNEVMGLSNKVVNSTATLAKRTSTQLVNSTASAAKRTSTAVTAGTGKVVVGTGKLMVKGSKGTGKVLVGTGKAGMDLAKGTGKVGMDVVKGTSNVMVGSTKAMVKGTGVLFSGTAGVMKASSKRLSKMVSNGMDSSMHRDSSDPDIMDDSERDRKSIFGIKKKTSGNSGVSANPRISFSPKGSIPLPRTSLTRQRSLDSAQAEALHKGERQAKLTDELLEMQDFLVQLEGMDKHTVQEIIGQEQAQRKGQNRVKQGTGLTNSFVTTPTTPSEDLGQDWLSMGSGGSRVKQGTGLTNSFVNTPTTPSEDLGQDWLGSMKDGSTSSKSRGTSLALPNATIAEEEEPLEQQQQKNKNRGTSLIPMQLSFGSRAKSAGSPSGAKNTANQGLSKSLHTPR